MDALVAEEARFIEGNLAPGTHALDRGARSGGVKLTEGWLFQLHDSAENRQSAIVPTREGWRTSVALPALALNQARALLGGRPERVVG